MEYFNNNKEFLVKMANTKMPYGKYKGRYIIDLPEHYMVWIKQKGFPNNDLGKCSRASTKSNSTDLSR